MRFAGDQFTGYTRPDRYLETIGAAMGNGAQVAAAEYGTPYTPMASPTSGLSVPSTSQWINAGQDLRKWLFPEKTPSEAPPSTDVSNYDAPIIDWQSALYGKSSAG